MTMVNPVYQIALLALELLCAIVGTLSMRKRWTLPYKVLVLLPWVTFFYESWQSYEMANRRNFTWVYNYWVPVETCVIAYILLTQASLRWVRRLFAWVVLYMMVTIIISFYQESHVVSMNLHLGIYCLFSNLIISCIMLFDILKNKTDLSIFRQPAFWVAIGMLFYSSIFIVIFSVGSYLMSLGYKIYIPFSVAANFFMYGGMIACFLTLKRECSKGAKGLAEEAVK